MAVSNNLNVWYNETLIGQIFCNTIGSMGFKYEEAWVAKGFPISQQLPLSETVYSPELGKAHRFFANLLPEAGARMHIVQDLKITNTDFILLRELGGECAGALSILPLDYPPQAEGQYKKLTSKELLLMVQQKKTNFSLGKEKMRPRLSLAGAQDKCLVFIEDAHYFLPLGASASTHILKFELFDYRHIPVYEYFLTSLASLVGLPTVHCKLKKIESDYFLLIERYDRILTADKKIKRLHQEDFCQALGIGYESKYQQDGGPSFGACYKLVQQISTDPIIDAENLIKWQIFNVLAGNSDGHAKNIAFLYDKRQTTLVPFYDLVCTRAIERIDKKLAFSIGGEFNPDILNWKHWALFAEECNIREQYLKKLLQQMAVKLTDNLSVAQQQFEDEHGPYPALQRVLPVIQKQCRRVLKYPIFNL